MFRKLLAILASFFVVEHISANDQSFSKIVLNTTKGEIIIQLLPDIAPSHVERISELVKTRFYSDINFHRVIKGFMAQTGDPLGNGTGGSGKTIKAEFSDYKFKYGTVGMARTMDPNSADSQFFICFNGCSHLTGQYTVWGQVISGMEVVENINIGEPPNTPDKIISATLER